MLEYLQKIDLSNKNRAKLKSKFFIVVLSTQRNLNLCREYSIAGFPETDNGQWAFLDIDPGDYISFYFNGRLWDLYEVVEKFIPYRWIDILAIGHELLDPEPLDGKDRWDSIRGGKQSIYFPFRLRLKRIYETTFDSSLVFKPGLERLGINLIPRVSLKKTHFQLSIKDIKKFFNIEPPIKEKDFNLEGFRICQKRSQNRENGKSSIDFEKGNIFEITHQEVYLQSFFKKILESYIWEMNCFRNFKSFEFLSEQTTNGGEPDIVILCKSDEDYEFYIELKNSAMVQNNQLTRKALEAENQVSRYQNLLNSELTLRGIGGKNSNNDNSLRIFQKENLLIFELDSETPLSIF